MSFDRCRFDGVQARDFARPPPDEYKWLVVGDIRQGQLVYCQELLGMSGSEVSFFLYVCRCVFRPRQIPCVKYRRLAQRKSSCAPEAADECPNDFHSKFINEFILDCRQNRPVEPTPFLHALSRPILLKAGVGVQVSYAWRLSKKLLRAWSRGSALRGRRNARSLLKELLCAWSPLGARLFFACQARCTVPPQKVAAPGRKLAGPRPFSKQFWNQ